MFGKLGLDDIPYHEPILVVTALVMALGGLAIVGALTYFKKWKWLWSEWITSVDHKKLGIMYFLVALIMLLRGFADAIMMRTQQAMAAGGSEGYLPPEHYDQIFTAHGVIMIFFVAMPMVIGLMNLVVPLQIGARDVAFPFMNNLSFWLFVAGVALTMISLLVGEYGKTGWLAYAPLSGIQYSPGVGVDYWIWGLQISGIGTTLTGINFFVTILKMRTKGMTMFRMPIFTWTSLVANVLIIASFPILTATIALLTLDRYLGTHFFTNDMGGNMMMYVNLIWAWGHPEVYILILPAFGVFSEVIATFAKKRLFGYNTMVWATLAIGILSFVVWLHHFFTMGAGANVNAFFGIATMIIAIPTGVKIFNWLFTMYRGRLEFTSPVLWTLGFIITFTIGGMTGVMLAVPGANFVLHNSLFVIAHFHNVIIGGVVFGMLAGLTYWFPKAFGFKLDEKWGKRSFWFWIVGFYLAFMPLYILSFMGAVRRMQSYANPEWQPLMIVAWVGAVCILLGIACTVIQFIVSIRDREKNADITGDPWDARTLEWSTSSPAPFYNFAHLPNVGSVDAFWEAKKEKGMAADKPTQYEDIHMPKNTVTGPIIGLISIVFGFALVWHIWWLAGVGAIGMFVAFMFRVFNDDIDYYVPAAEVERIEREHHKRLEMQA
ncbi:MULTISPECIES: cytochrome o ubiquinol oxidase subunit I [Chromohalobacter]|uniref:Cytochrome bo(3) ubiquinol oxidase subunit 1 n=1 Tax=Chromohalobacter moromii TaxID=2860329 RepID=A0A9X2X0H1_9GAMM|nr:MULTISPECIES: cytochrome o ubiquinol oxidase subunit I [Chromohalobacter]MCK2044443.1 cytochrome o ubiquinol oxidase subunit I [Chromohalobacter moromii]MCT8467424.1 cytochrome o ubiquinol oxidase subunit I [Chromohalobacter canadensis]MCT8470828.1 cytochrome o ubiquinol oxidase subunit I [Chromohalobacter canadensis]MCT8497921.1 cytochrome o ubiquinol oxidase subunit I [Chromohalobacter canadensis]MCT8504395.1 cytochrome o ubiquinol oxidase subunit I [Chromohalobacter moromii]